MKKEISEKEYQETLKRVKARAGTAKKAPAPTESEAVVPAQLPAWAEVVRGVPNSLLRSALFGVSKKREIYSKRTLIASVDGYEIRFMGFGFNQTDLDTLEGMLHSAMPHPLGKRVEFSVHSFLKSLGRGVGKEQHEQFKEQVIRLMSGVVEITDLKAKKTFMGSLVYKAFRDEDTGNYVVIFDKDILTLYESGYSLLDPNIRIALGSNNLAKWLYGNYTSHARPLPYKVETIWQLCRSDTKELWKFRQMLKRALEELQNVGAIDGWMIDENDLVHIERTPSRSQQKHLKRQPPKAKP